MKKIYQTFIDKDKGNCMQAAFASLFDEDLDNVPHFLSFGDQWFSEIYKFLQSKGYEYEGMIYNKKYSQLSSPTSDCFKNDTWDESQLISKERLTENGGVNGLFYAGVWSPRFFNLHDGFHYTHAVIIDTDCNIVHDPNPGYKDILRYPLADVIGYNGIIDVMLFNKIP